MLSDGRTYLLATFFRLVFHHFLYVGQSPFQQTYLYPMSVGQHGPRSVSIYKTLKIAAYRYDDASGLLIIERRTARQRQRTGKKGDHFCVFLYIFWPGPIIAAAQYDGERTG